MADELVPSSDNSIQSKSNVSLSELKGLSKPLCKLVDAVRAGAGMVYLPTHTRRMAQARADAAKIKATSDAEVAVISATAAAEAALIGAKADADALALISRTKERIYAREMKRQKNIEAIADKAADQMPETVSDTNPEGDWMTSFFEQCQDVSDDQMQTVWAKILAGEVARPGSFSPRALAMIKILRKEEASLFTRVCSYTWSIANRVEPLIYEEGHGFPDVALTLEELKTLDSIGLIDVMDLGTRHITFNYDGPLDARTVGVYFSRPHVIDFPKGNKSFPMGKVQFTPLGKELFAIAGAEPDDEYRKRTIARWTKENYLITDVAPEGAGFKSFVVG